MHEDAWLEEAYEDRTYIPDDPEAYYFEPDYGPCDICGAMTTSDNGVCSYCKENAQ